MTDPQLDIVFTVFGAQVAQAIAADLTGNPSTTAKPYLDIVDRLPARTRPMQGPIRSLRCSS